MDENATFNPFEYVTIDTSHMEPPPKSPELDSGEVLLELIIPSTNDRFIPWQKIATTGIFVFIVITCLISNVYFVRVLFLLRSKLTKSPFFIIVWQLTFANIVSALANIVKSFPLLFDDNNSYYITSPYYQLSRTADNLADQLVLYCILIIAINRCCIFVTRKYAGQLFSRSMMVLWSFMIWGLSITFCIISYIGSCQFKYLPYEEIFIYNCRVYLFANDIEDMNKYMSISGLLLAYLVTHCHIPDNWAFNVNKIVNSIELLAGALTPVFLVVSSLKIKKAAKRPFISCCKGKKQSVNIVMNVVN